MRLCEREPDRLPFVRTKSSAHRIVEPCRLAVESNLLNLLIAELGEDSPSINSGELYRYKIDGLALLPQVPVPASTATGERDLCQL
jgi:hypothetical protein